MDTFMFHVEQRIDGLLAVSSPDLRGFRLVLNPGDDVDAEIKQALTVFYPHYRAAKARMDALSVQPVIGQHRDVGEGSYDVSARFSFQEACPA